MSETEAKSEMIAKWKDIRAASDALAARREDMVRDIKTAFEQERDRR